MKEGRGREEDSKCGGKWAGMMMMMIMVPMMMTTMVLMTTAAVREGERLRECRAERELERKKKSVSN